MDKKPDTQPDALIQFTEWRDTLKTAIAKGSGVCIEEATRLVLCLGVILRSYEPQYLTREVMDDVRNDLRSALERIADATQKGEFGEDTSEHYQIYRRNVSERYQDWLNMCEKKAA